MERLIIDGYNVIYAVPALRQALDRSLEAARQALIAYCRAFQAGRLDLHLTIVFDGTEGSAVGVLPPVGGISVLYTDRSEEADERILALLRSQPWSRVTVVSNDIYITNNARAHGARVIPADHFFPPARTSRPPAGRRREPSGKAALPARAAAAITEEYRSYLQRKRP